MNVSTVAGLKSR